MNNSTQKVCDSIERTMVTLEKSLNVAGYIPIVSTLSGSLRGGLGTLELKIGVIAGIGLALGAIITDSDELAEASGKSFEYGLHGIGNVLRGGVEIIPLINLLTIPYDTINRFSYAIEARNQNFAVDLVEATPVA